MYGFLSIAKSWNAIVYILIIERKLQFVNLYPHLISLYSIYEPSKKKSLVLFMVIYKTIWII